MRQWPKLNRLVPLFLVTVTVGLLVGWYLLLHSSTKQLLSPLMDVWKEWNEAARRAVYLAEMASQQTESKLLTTNEITETVQTARRAANQPELQTNEALNKFARLLTLEVEDQQTLEITNTEDILEGLVPQPPARVETVLLFIPQWSQMDWRTELASESALLDPEFTLLGIATRSAEFKSLPGTIATVVVSTDFFEPQPTTNQGAQPASTRPNFTGQDLWQAVQTYRRAHDLPEFQMHEELCTVSAIRLNQQIELGKLDNHAGFKEQSDAFFKKNPSWTNINENLAGGYDTATQTVEWGWDQSLGHQALIKSREFPYACTSASYGFAVLITGK